MTKKLYKFCIVPFLLIIIADLTYGSIILGRRGESEPPVSYDYAYYVRNDGTATKANAEVSSGGGCSSASTAMSVSTHNSSTFSDNTIIYLCPAGGTFTSPIVMPSSGTSGNEIVYDGYEADDTTFAGLSESTGRANFDVDTGNAIQANEQSFIIIQDLEVSDANIGVYIFDTSHDIVVKRSYFHELDRNAGYVGSVSPASIPYNITFGGAAGQGIVAKNIGTGTSDADVVICRAHDIVVSYNHLYADNQNWGIDGVTVTCGTGGVTYDILIEYNSIHDHDDNVGEAGEDGLDFKYETYNVVVRFNHIYGHYNGVGSGGNGINLNTGLNNYFIYGNKIDTNTTGIYCSDDYDNVNIFGNIIASQRSRGITKTDIGSSSTIDTWNVFNNTFALNGTNPSNSTYTAYYLDTNDNLNFNNNIVYKSRPNNTDGYQAYLSTKTDDNVDSDNNIYFWPSDTSLFYWGDEGWRTLAQLQAGSSNGLPQENSSSEENPDLEDIDNGDYRIAGTGSGAYGAGTDLGSGNIASLTINGQTVNVPWGFAFGPGTDFSGTIPVIDEENFDTIGRWDAGSYAFIQ